MNGVLAHPYLLQDRNQEGRLTEYKVEEKERGGEIGASREHTLIKEEYGFWNCCWVLQADAE